MIVIGIDPHMAIHPPWPHMVELLTQMGMRQEAQAIAEALRSIGWRA